MTDGVDCSHFNGAVNWQQVRGSGVKFAAVKATESVSYVDPTFARNWGQMAVVGLQRTAYHFARPERSAPDVQVRHFTDTVGALAANDLPLVLDLEASKLTGPATVDWAASFLSQLDSATGRRSIIYTGPGFIRSLGGTVSELTRWPLWVARYRGSSYKAHAAAKDPGPVDPWTSWLWWQYSDAGTVPGVAGTCDVNRAQSIPTPLPKPAPISKDVDMVILRNPDNGGKWLCRIDGTKWIRSRVTDTDELNFVASGLVPRGATDANVDWLAKFEVVTDVTA